MKVAFADINLFDNSRAFIAALKKEKYTHLFIFSKQPLYFSEKEKKFQLFKLLLAENNIPFNENLVIAPHPPQFESFIKKEVRHSIDFIYNLDSENQYDIETISKQFPNLKITHRQYSLGKLGTSNPLDPTVTELKEKLLEAYDTFFKATTLLSFWFDKTELQQAQELTQRLNQMDDLDKMHKEIFTFLNNNEKGIIHSKSFRVILLASQVTEKNCWSPEEKANKVTQDFDTYLQKYRQENNIPSQPNMLKATPVISKGTPFTTN